MSRILFVSRHYASDFGVKVGGVFQRMRMLLEAAARSADVLDILFFVDPSMIDRVGPLVAQQSLEEHWHLAANVRLAPRMTTHHGRVRQTLRALVDFRAQDDYFRFNGPEQRRAVRSAVFHDTRLVVAHRLYTGSAVVAADIGKVPIVMDLDDVEHRNRERQVLHGEAGRMAGWEVGALRRGELSTIRACATSFVCSDIDRSYLADKGASNTTVIPNALHFPAQPPLAPFHDQAPVLFFIGTYGYTPNRAAAEFLIRTIYPRILSCRPDVRLLIVGEAVEKLASHAEAPPGVEFVGFVPDLTDVYRRATIVCCPILAGGGTRIKIIEAAAASRPVVSTTIGAEGLGFEDGLEILLRDSPDAFAEACIALIDDPQRAERLARAAHLKARSLFEREGVVERIARSYESHALTHSA